LISEYLSTLSDVDIGLDTKLPDLNAVVDDLQDYGVYTHDVDVAFDRDELFSSDDADEHVSQRNRGKNTTAQERQGIYEALLGRSTRGKLKRKSTNIVAEQFQVGIRTVQRISEKAKKCHAQGEPVDVSSRIPKNCGRKRVQFDLSRVANVPYHKRSTIRKLAKELEVSKSLLHKWFKEGLLRRHSNALKPFLKDGNKKERLSWCLSMLDPATLPHEPKFIEMDNIIHIDEKWFNATKKNKKFYMLPGEADPHRTVQNKNSIDKVMVLSAVALPRHDVVGNKTFSGKIGVWPFVRKVSHPSYQFIYSLCKGYEFGHAVSFY
jgi:hypothetical protein